MMETSISYFHASFYIPLVQKVEFHLPHICILGTHHCDNTRHEASKCCRAFQDVLCSRDYFNKVVSSFAQQI